MWGPVLGPNSVTSGSSGVVGQLADGADAEPLEALRDPVPIPHSAVVGRSPITSNQLSRVSWKTPRGLPKSVAILARTLVSPMPTEQCRPVASSTAACRSARDGHRVVGLDADERLVPAEHLDHGAVVRAQRPPSPAPRPPRRPGSRPAGTPRRGSASPRSAAPCRSGCRRHAPRRRPSRRRPRSVGSPRPPTTTGRPASSGRRSTSTAARNWSMSTCSTQRAMPPSCRATPTAVGFRRACTPARPR